MSVVVKAKPLGQAFPSPIICELMLLLIRKLVQCVPWGPSTMHAVAQFAEALCYEPEGRRYDSR
jgi:hypothetical protein